MTNKLTLANKKRTHKKLSHNPSSPVRAAHISLHIIGYNFPDYPPDIIQLRCLLEGGTIWSQLTCIVEVHRTCLYNVQLKPKFWLRRQTNQLLSFVLYTSAILDFWKPDFWFLGLADFPSVYQIWCKCVHRRRNYCPKSSRPECKTLTE